MARTGRPPKYTGNLKRHIVGLIRQHNASTAMAILNASNRSSLAQLRRLRLVPKPLGISMPTLLGYAKAAGVALKVGRPSKAA